VIRLIATNVAVAFPTNPHTTGMSLRLTDPAAIAPPAPSVALHPMFRPRGCQMTSTTVNRNMMDATITVGSHVIPEHSQRPRMLALAQWRGGEEARRLTGCRCIWGRRVQGMIRLTRAPDLLMAQHWVNLLQAAGIRCRLSGVYLQGGAGELPVDQC